MAKPIKDITNRTWSGASRGLKRVNRIEGPAVGGGTVVPMSVEGWFDRIEKAAFRIIDKGKIPASVDDEIVFVLEPHRKPQVIIRERDVDY